jgi:hypothetical protein
VTLGIRRLATRCHAPRTLARSGAIVDDVARDMLGAELAACLGPSLDRLPAFVRIRALRVRVTVSARRLTARALAEAWSRALARALHQALAYPDGDGVYAIRRYQSGARYRAALLQCLVAGDRSAAWQFPEMASLSTLGAADAALRIMLDHPPAVAATIRELSRAGGLDAVLGVWDELALERVMQAIAGIEGGSDDITLPDFIALVRAASASGVLLRAWPFAHRRQAIRLWASAAASMSVRDVWHALRLIRLLVETPPWRARSTLAPPAGAIPFPDWCERIVAERAAAWQAPELAGARSSRIAALDAAIDDLRPLVPSALPRESTGEWLESECAGVFLLASIVQRLGLWALARRPELAPFGGPRGFSLLLAGTAMTLLGPWEPHDPIEPAVALFAGASARGGDLDRTEIERFFAEADVGMLDALDGIVGGSTWRAALDALADDIARRFAQRIRGFRQASREAVVRQFVRLRGRVLVEERRLLVVLDPSPWTVALHIAGADTPIDSVEWCGERRLEFLLEGL